MHAQNQKGTRNAWSIITAAALAAGVSFGGVSSAAPANAVNAEETASAGTGQAPRQLTNIPEGQDSLTLNPVSPSTSQEGTPAISTRAALPDDDEVVNIPDPALGAALRLASGGKPTLTHGVLRTITRLDAGGNDIKDLTGLAYASNLQILNLRGNPITSIEPLRGMTSLTGLNISSTMVTDISAVSTMSAMEYLQINWTTVSDLEPVRGKADIWRIELAGTQVASLDPLSTLPRLAELYFQETRVSDIRPLSGSTNLGIFSAADTDVSDLSPIAGLPYLNTVAINGAKVADLTMIDTWPSLQRVDFLNQRLEGPTVFASKTESSYRRAVAQSAPFTMFEDVVFTAYAGASDSGGITTWSNLSPSATTIPTTVLGDPWPGSGALYSANMSYPLSRADFTNEPTAASIGMRYSFQLDVTEGFEEGPFKLVSGSVPGLTVSDSGRISGIPTERGTFPIEVTRTDLYGNTITGSFNFVVGDAVDAVINVADAAVTYGQSATLTATVTDPPLETSVIASIGGVEYGPIALDGTSAEINVPALAQSAGNHVVSISLVDSETPEWIFAAATAQLTVKKATTQSTAVLSKDQKSVSGKVAGQFGTIPTGTVTLAHAGKTDGTAKLANDGSYRVTLPNWSVPKAKETRTVVATYTGDANHTGSNASVSVTLAPAVVEQVKPCMEPRKVPVFADTPLGHKFYKEIDWMECMKYSTGWKQPSGKPLYKPQDNLSRAAMAAFIFRMEGDKNFKAPKVSPFADMKPGDKFYREISWMWEAKLSTGNKEASGKPTYRPNEDLSREAMAAFIYRLEAKSDASVKNFQAPKVSAMADMKPGMKFYKEIAWMYDAKLTTGNKVGGYAGVLAEG